LDIEGVATVLPVEDLASAVQVWTALLGAALTSVDSGPGGWPIVFYSPRPR
jgi:hypothetical protein